MKFYDVRIDGKDYSGLEIRSGGKVTQAVLKTARENIGNLPNRKKRLSERSKTYSLWPCCLCQPTPIPMQVRKISGNYYLCKMPETGGNHAEDCRNHEVAIINDSHGLGQHGINYKEDGSILISIPFNLGCNGEDDNTSSESKDFNPENGQILSSQGRVTLLGMLWFFWDLLKLNTWIQGVKTERNHNSVTKYLCGLSQEKIFIQSYPLQDVLMCTGAFRKETVLEKITSQYGVNKSQSSRRMILIGEFAGLQLLKSGFFTELRLKSYSGTIAVWMKDGLSQRLRKSYMPQRDVSDENRYWMIAVVHFDFHTGRLLVDEVSAMLMNRAYIPGHSTYEILAANFLIKNKRNFNKPVIWDRNKPVHPDFELLDCDCCDAHPFEVVGMETQDYQSRYEEKMKKYEELSLCGCSIWNANKNKALTDVHLPSVKQDR